MPLRLIELMLPQATVEMVHLVLEEQNFVDVWYGSLSESQALVKILVTAEQAEPLIQMIEKQLPQAEGFRVVMLPVAASIPRVKDQENGPQDEQGKPSVHLIAGRISREELYTQISDSSNLTLIFSAMVLLSAIVAAIGLLQNSAASVIGAMVIAPLLGPNIALALATNLGDMPLAKKSLITNAAGLLIALALSIILGTFLEVNPNNPQIASRTHIGLLEVILALAAGAAGALAFTSGAPATLIGVMVAVALLPPLVVLGLLLGSMHLFPALEALWLVLTNLICINLSAVVTFWLQGVRPTTWWEENIARRATITSITLCVLLLIALIVIIFFTKKV